LLGFAGGVVGVTAVGIKNHSLLAFDHTNSNPCEEVSLSNISSSHHSLLIPFKPYRESSSLFGHTISILFGVTSKNIV
jgi:hypothetical protein